MMQLITLGRLELSDGEGHDFSELLRQPKRFALLLYLASPTPGIMHQRDTLLGLFWPELDQVHARSALRNSLSQLRRVLGHDLVVRRGDESVGLNGDLLWYDASAFERALDEHRWSEAIGLYGGELLKGFYLSECPEFERWLDNERARLSRRYASVLEELANAAAQAGDGRAAVEWWESLTRHDPYDSRYAIGLIRALENVGDPANALLHARTHNDLLREELETEPPSEFQAIVERMREKSRGVEGPPAAPELRNVPLERVAVAASPSLPSRNWSIRSVATVGALIVLASAIVGAWLLRPSPDPLATRTAVAVLPFEDLTAEQSQAYLVRGLHDELITQLFKVAALKVIGRTSVLDYAGTTKPLSQIAQELGVGSIVEGSARVQGNRLRVNVQLVDATTGETLWAKRYDRTLNDAFATQSEIAERIVTVVGATLTDAEASAIATALTDNPEAYRFYLQGEEYLRGLGNDRQNLEVAQQLFERALELDPEFALAYARLARVHGSMFWLAYDPYPSRIEAARVAVEAAERLAPGLPRVHQASAFLHFLKGDRAKALEEYVVAAEGLPGDAGLRAMVGRLHRSLGKWDQALTELEKATELDPRDASVFHALGITFLFLHRYDDAVAAYNRALELAPDLAHSQLQKAWAYLHWRGDLDRLRNLLARGPEDYGNPGSRDLWRVRLALWERKPEVMLTLLGDTPELVTFQSQHGYTTGLLYAAWAFQLRGDRAAATRAFSGALVQLDSVLHDLPGDERVHLSRGLALAGLGRQSEARQEADFVIDYDPYDRLWWGELRSMIFAQAGLVDEALAEIELLVDGPSITSVHMVRMDPRYDPIRDDPRFQALLDRYEN